MHVFTLTSLWRGSNGKVLHKYTCLNLSKSMTSLYKGKVIDNIHPLFLCVVSQLNQFTSLSFLDPFTRLLVRHVPRAEGPPTGPSPVCHHPRTQGYSIQLQ